MRVKDIVREIKFRQKWPFGDKQVKKDDQNVYFCNHFTVEGRQKATFWKINLEALLLGGEKILLLNLFC